MSHLLEIAEQLNLSIALKQKNVIFTLKDSKQSISIENKKVSQNNLYDVQFFKDYFENREQEEAAISENLMADFESYCEKQDTDKIAKDDLYQAYQDFKEKRDRIQEFEVVLAENQIDKLVKESIFIRINYGIKKDGLVFISNRNLDIQETDVGKSYRVFIRETAQFFIYNKENSGLNRYMRGRDLIRQLSHDSKYIPKRRRPTLAILK